MVWKVFAVKAFTLLVVLVLLWRHNIVDSFLSAGLLKSEETGSVCDKHPKGFEHSTSVCSCLWSMGGNNKKFKKKCVCCLARQIGV
jgi:hypothetical protein